MNLRVYKNRIHTGLRTGLIHIGYYSRPRFLIIGTQKGGTDALYRYLAEHPNIMPATKKEIGYFDQDKLYSRGQNWYHSHFPLPNRLGYHSVTFEATPEYLYYPKAAQRIFSYKPNIKLIVLLREPVERAFSAWNMFRNLCHEHPEYLRALASEYDQVAQDVINTMLCSNPFPEFDRAVRDEIDGILSGNSVLEPGYVRRGLYYEQLLRYFQYFDRKQIFIIDSRRLKSDIGSVLSEIIQFLSLPKYDWHQKSLSLFHVGRYEEQIAGKTHALLREFYKPYNEKLYELLGHDLGW
jgi:hypothetical protein